MTDAGMTGEVARSFRPARDSVDKVGAVVACRKGSANEGDEVCGRPSCLLTVLDNNRISRKESADYRSEQVVKRVTGR